MLGTNIGRCVGPAKEAMARKLSVGLAQSIIVNFLATSAPPPKKKYFLHTPLAHPKHRCKGPIA